MSESVKLIPLLCVKCQSPLTAQADEVAWACPACGQGQLLMEDKGLVAMQFYYDSRLTPGQPGKPYWVAQGQAQLSRSTYSGNQSAEMLAYWSQPRLFFIPAFSLPLEQLIAVGSALLRQPPSITQGSPAAFQPVTLHPEDLRPMAEFILISMEAERRDMLKELNFNLTLSAPALWILP
jgi:predicted RNA-binding Zn-ribbon protein involved in translation (DUF1610 family)